jgi:alkylresorcinol/alkylpyrone synthase
LTPQAGLLSVATASPPHTIRQEDVAAAAREQFAGRFRDFDRLSPIFTNAGIATRQSVQPLDWYLTPHGWPERTAAYLEGADALFVAAAEAALREAGLGAADIDSVVTVSSTGIATPSLEARAMRHMPFRADVSRIPVFGLGCAGGVTGLALAAKLARASPGSKVLFVCVELCTLAVRLDQLDSANIVATALFGDGAAACVISTEGEALAKLDASAEHTWPDTLAIMGWSVDPEGFGVIFDRSIPAFAATKLRGGMESLLAGMDVAPESVARFVCHPGGSKVVEAIERSLQLGQGALEIERDVLREHGNMSAPTALFVLKRVLERGGTGRLILTALGPGFTASTVALSA